MTENRLARETNVDKIAGAIYVAVAVIGGVPIIQTKILGVVPTYYRVIIPLLFVYFLISRIRNLERFSHYNKRYIALVGYLILMVAWGIFMLVTAQYVDKREGMRELLELVLGILSVLIIYEVCLRQKGFYIIIWNLRLVIVALTVLAIIEMSTAIHLYTSKFSDPEYIARYMEHAGSLPADGKISYNCTGVFYNENDFSAFLGIFVPVFFPQKTYSKLVNVLFSVELVLILVILSQNDAWICMFSPIVGTAAYLLITRAKARVWLISAAAFVVVKMFGVNAFAGIAYIIYKIVPGVDVPFGISTMFHEGSSGLSEVVEGQLDGVKSQSGSAFTRTHTYLEGLKRTFTDSYGLGFGPGSYENYVKSNPDSNMLSNPHSMWLELVMHYGIFLTLIFLILILWLFFRLFILYRETHRIEYALIIAMDIIFVPICFAPSSFFGISYMWIPIGLSLVFSNIQLDAIKRPERKRKYF